MEEWWINHQKGKKCESFYKKTINNKKKLFGKKKVKQFYRKIQYIKIKKNVKAVQ